MKYLFQIVRDDLKDLKKMPYGLGWVIIVCMCSALISSITQLIVALIYSTLPTGKLIMILAIGLVTIVISLYLIFDPAIRKMKDSEKRAKELDSQE